MQEALTMVLVAQEVELVELEIMEQADSQLKEQLEE
jgi:hypothetical protein